MKVVKHMRKKIILIICLLYLFIPNIYASERETVTFSKCVDGDTIKVLIDKKEYTVRFLAVDTPESVHPTKDVEYYGKEASEYTCNKVKNAKKLELEYDQNSDKQDKYDRLLAWIFTDDELLQASLVELGYAKVAYLYGDYKYTDILKAKQELASAKSIGIWNTEELNNFTNNQEDTKEEEYTTKEEDATEEEYTTKEIIVIVVLFLVIIFIGNKSIKKKAQKKLKKYLK